MVSLVTATSFLEPINCQSLVIFAEKLSSGRIVWQKYQHRHDADNGDDPLDDEKPSKPCKTIGTIDMSYAKRNGAAKGSGKVAKRDDECDAQSPLIMPIPYGDEIDNAREEASFEDSDQQAQRQNRAIITNTGKPYGDNTPAPEKEGQPR